MQAGHQLKIRLPTDVKAFVAEQADRYGGSLNSEIIRAIRERMERTPAHGTQRNETPKAAAA